MIAAWMVYASAVTAFFYLGAVAVEKSMRLARRPGRWMLAAAIASAVIVPIVTRSESAGGSADVAGSAATAPTASLVPLAAIFPDSGDLQGLNLPLIALWIGVSAVLVALVLFTQVRLAKKTSVYREENCCGTTVLRSPALGPAVVGWLKSSIVIPAWVDEVSRDWRELMVQHEQEHLRSRDAQLLSAAVLLVVLQPWNLPLWGMLFRLRRAIELDCDQRVLKSGVDVRLYGNLLIEVSRRRLRTPLSIVGFAVTKSFLASRVDAMTLHRSAFRCPKALLATALGAALAVIACQLPAPVDTPDEAHAALREVAADSIESSTTAEPSLVERDDAPLVLQPASEDLWRISKAADISAVLKSNNLERLPEDLVERLRNTAILMRVTEQDGKPVVVLRKVHERDGGEPYPAVLPEPIGQ